MSRFVIVAVLCISTLVLCMSTLVLRSCGVDPGQFRGYTSSGFMPPRHHDNRSCFLHFNQHFQTLTHYVQMWVSFVECERLDWPRNVRTPLSQYAGWLRLSSPRVEAKRRKLSEGALRWAFLNACESLGRIDKGALRAIMSTQSRRIRAGSATYQSLSDMPRWV